MRTTILDQSQMSYAVSISAYMNMCNTNKSNIQYTHTPYLSIQTPTCTYCISSYIVSLSVSLCLSLSVFVFLSFSFIHLFANKLSLSLSLSLSLVSLMITNHSISKIARINPLFYSHFLSLSLLSCNAVMAGPGSVLNTICGSPFFIPNVVKTPS